MIVAVLAAAALAPLYWLAVPGQHRALALTGLSLAALSVWDPRLLLFVPLVSVTLFAVLRTVQAASGRRRDLLAAAALCALLALFLWNKMSGAGFAVLASQSGLALLGVSYLAIKAAALIVETARENSTRARLGEITSWIVFLPTYPSGPMEDFDHFRAQQPRCDRQLVWGGLERVLFGLVKTMLIAQPAGAWATTVLQAPNDHSAIALVGGLYAFTLRLYFDFSGYSDIAIGLAALYGYRIEENFDWPLARRNLASLWQHWHMTLTRFLRLYLFTPISRRLLRRGWGEVVSIGGAQIAAMSFCGLWHGVGLNFLIWGLLQAAGLIWLGVFARRIGRRAPRPLLRWWRQSWLAHALGVGLTFNYFSFTILFFVADTAGAMRYLRAIVAG